MTDWQTLATFLFVTGVLGASAAWVTGRSVARTWTPLWHLALYVVLLAGAARFLDFALFAGDLSSPTRFAVDAAVLAAAALLGYRVARTRQMVEQYPWAFQRTGPLSWRRRERA